MAWAARFTAAAEKRLSKLDRPIQRRILAFLEELVQGDPRSSVSATIFRSSARDQLRMVCRSYSTRCCIFSTVSVSPRQPFTIHLGPAGDARLHLVPEHGAGHQLPVLRARPRSPTSGREPTTDMCLCSTLKNCGSSSGEVLRRKAPKRVTRGSARRQCQLANAADNPDSTWTQLVHLPERCCAVATLRTSP